MTDFLWNLAEYLVRAAFVILPIAWIMTNEDVISEFFINMI